VTAYLDRGTTLMRTSYDPQADAFYARFTADGTPIVETREVAPSVMIDLDASGDTVGSEVPRVARR